jgi:poly-beta-1,6-N-acetyl-D-glucosamine synthase
MIYIFFIALLLIAWYNLRPPGKTQISDIQISVIVPVRNEEANIGNLLTDLKNQSYKNFEVIIVDDHSVDQTVSATMPHANDKIKIVVNEGEGKKAAITTGVRNAKGDIVVTTDADCRVRPLWLDTITEAFADRQQKLIVGPVRMSGSDLFGHMQQMEFASLIGSAASSLSLDYPIMCNGANLAYRRSAFLEVGGYDGNSHIASGDDEFLMRKIHTRYNKGISFLLSKDAIVSTQPTATLQQFLQQRVRWAGKWRSNSSITAICVALFIFVVSASSVIGIAMLVLTKSKILGLMLLIKLVAEAFILSRYCAFLEIKWRWPAFLALEIIYPFYVVVVGLAANFLSFKWKGRRYRAAAHKNRL